MHLYIIVIQDATTAWLTYWRTPRSSLSVESAYNAAHAFYSNHTDDDDDDDDDDDNLISKVSQVTLGKTGFNGVLLLYFYWKKEI